MSDLPPASIPPVPEEASPYIPPAAPLIPPGADLALTETDKTTAMFCHLIAFAGVVIPFPFVNVIGPLVLWLTQKDKSAYIDHHGKESLNFQITVAIASAIAFLTIFILVGFLLLPAVAIYAIVMTIIAAIKAKEGVNYRYPYTLRLVK